MGVAEGGFLQPVIDVGPLPTGLRSVRKSGYVFVRRGLGSNYTGHSRIYIVIGVLRMEKRRVLNRLEIGQSVARQKGVTHDGTTRNV